MDYDVPFREKGNAVGGHCVLSPVSRAAHPVPFSYVDARIQPGAIDVTVVAHIFDLANDLKLQPPERLLDAATLAAQASAITNC